MSNLKELARVQRLQKVRDMLDRDCTEEEISQNLDISVRTVQRLKRDLRALQTSDLTPVEVASKRAEVYLDLTETISEAKERYLECVENNDLKYAKLFLEMWSKIIMDKAKLYGLDKVSPNTAIQINTVTNNTPRHQQVDSLIGMEISEDIKLAHEETFEDYDRD